MAEESKQEGKREGPRGGFVVGLILVGLGFILLLDNFFPGLGFGSLWPAIIIIWGAAVFVSGFLPPFSFGRLLRGIFIGTVGVILLYNALGIVPYGFWVEVLTLWPVFLIALGLAILGGVTRSRFISALPSVVIIATLILAFVYRGIVFEERGLTRFELSKGMISGVKAGTASVDLPIGDLDIGSTDELYSIDAREPFGRERPKADFERSGSSVDLRVTAPKEVRFFFGNRERKWKVLLSEDINWHLDVNGGVSNSELDLSDLQVRKLDLKSGVGDMTVRFGDRLERADANINSGVSRLKILVPETAGVRLTVDRGLSTSDFRNIDLRRIAGEEEAVYETPDFDEAESKLAINVDIGITSFTVEGY